MCFQPRANTHDTTRTKLAHMSGTNEHTNEHADILKTRPNMEVSLVNSRVHSPCDYSFRKSCASSITLHNIKVFVRSSWPEKGPTCYERVEEEIRATIRRLYRVLSGGTTFLLNWRFVYISAVYDACLYFFTRNEILTDRHRNEARGSIQGERKNKKGRRQINMPRVKEFGLRTGEKIGESCIDGCTTNLMIIIRAWEGIFGVCSC